MRKACLPGQIWQVCVDFDGILGFCMWDLRILQSKTLDSIEIHGFYWNPCIFMKKENVFLLVPHSNMTAFCEFLLIYAGIHMKPVEFCGFHSHQPMIPLKSMISSNSMDFCGFRSQKPRIPLKSWISADFP